MLRVRFEYLNFLLPGFLLPGFLLPGFLLPGYLNFLLPGFLLPEGVVYAGNPGTTKEEPGLGPLAMAAPCPQALALAASFVVPASSAPA